MLWVVIAASVAALGAVLFGVFRAKKAHDSLGLEQITKWRKDWVPITVLVDFDNFLPEEVAKLKDAVRAAAHFWNEQVGVKLFASSMEIGTGATVPVMRHDPHTMEERKEAAAYAALHLNKKGELVRATVYMADWENLPSLILARTMKHELGHCLGLAHDEAELSVMYGKTSDRIYCVSPLDKEFLREVYGAPQT